jgi:hypothetical protein
MNRHERRRAAKVGVGSVINVSIGRIITKDDGALTCYACGRSATDSPCGDGNALYGAAIINDERPVPVCEGCFASENSAGVVRKYWNAPDLKFSEGGAVNSLEEVHQIADALRESAKIGVRQ